MPTLHTVVTKEQLRTFIYLPKLIHQHHANWVPPLYDDEWKFYDPTENRALQQSDTVLVLAYEGDKPVGRIMGIIPHEYNQLKGEQTARFYNLDCFDDASIAQALIGFVEDWARSNGATQMIGPFGFSDKDPQGAQIEGFEHLPVIATATNLPYIPTFITQQGYQKLIDCLVYRLDIPKQLPATYERVLERVLRNQQLRMIEFSSRKALKPYIVPVLRLVNETYEPLFGFVPMTEAEMKHFAAQYLPILDPAFVKVIVDTTGNPVAFVVAMPDLSKGIQKAKGKIFPFGFIHILLEARKTKQLDLLLGAVRPAYRGRGLTILMGKRLFDEALKRGLTYIDSHLVLETNTLMRAELENLGGVVYKRYRVYEKTLG
ncbi:MAG: GNAT family N-acetyltransferase [Spirosomataceae bacterium]